jgi:hypothetical protein
MGCPSSRFAGYLSGRPPRGMVTGVSTSQNPAYRPTHRHQHSGHSPCTEVPYQRGPLVPGDQWLVGLGSFLRRPTGTRPSRRSCNYAARTSCAAWRPQTRRTLPRARRPTHPISFDRVPGSGHDCWCAKRSDQRSGRARVREQTKPRTTAVRGFVATVLRSPTGVGRVRRPGSPHADRPSDGHCVTTLAAHQSEQVGKGPRQDARPVVDAHPHAVGDLDIGHTGGQLDNLHCAAGLRGSAARARFDHP